MRAVLNWFLLVLLGKCKGLCGGNLVLLPWSIHTNTVIALRCCLQTISEKKPIITSSYTVAVRASLPLKATLPPFPFASSVSLCRKTVEPKPNHSIIRLVFFTPQVAKPSCIYKPFHKQERMSLRCLHLFCLAQFTQMHTMFIVYSLTGGWCRPSQCMWEMNLRKKVSRRTPFREHSSFTVSFWIPRSSAHSCLKIC